MIIIISDGGNQSAFSYVHEPTQVFSNGMDDEMLDIYSQYIKENPRYRSREIFIQYLHSRGFKRVAFEDIPL